MADIENKQVKEVKVPLEEQDILNFLIILRLKTLLTMEGKKRSLINLERS